MNYFGNIYYIIYGISDKFINNVKEIVLGFNIALTKEGNS